MNKVTVEVPFIAAVAVTRVMLGAGAALLLAGRLKRRQRRRAGWGLLLTGAVTTVPLMARLVCGCRRDDEQLPQ